MESDTTPTPEAMKCASEWFNGPTPNPIATPSVKMMAVHIDRHFSPLRTENEMLRKRIADLEADRKRLIRQLSLAGTLCGVYDTPSLRAMCNDCGRLLDALAASDKIGEVKHG